MDSKKVEGNGFTKSPSFLKKIELIHYNTDNCLVGKIKK